MAKITSAGSMADKRGAPSLGREQWDTWPTYDAATRATMVFDAQTRVEDDPRGEIREFFEQFPLPQTPIG